ncbi:hypothetical protein NPIL_469791 [Nephila pilipes]|uniref:Uncharacterized protein n=1 Tax=Nephila pilipes TaxID=299642 RepID=A0A8X6THU7_NEPPI|nr:hypothetical protein NPIL_469791 [Nephila pilipes]
MGDTDFVSHFKFDVVDAEVGKQASHFSSRAPILLTRGLQHQGTCSRPPEVEIKPTNSLVTRVIMSSETQHKHRQRETMALE